MRHYRAAVLFLLMLPANAFAQQSSGLTGAEREEFVTAGAASCRRSQADNPENACISAEVIAAYCDCVMNRIADQVTVDEVIALGSATSIPEAMQQKLNAAAEECVASVVPR